MKQHSQVLAWLRSTMRDSACLAEEAGAPAVALRRRAALTFRSHEGLQGALLRAWPHAHVLPYLCISSSASHNHACRSSAGRPSSEARRLKTVVL